TDEYPDLRRSLYHPCNASHVRQHVKPYIVNPRHPTRSRVNTLEEIYISVCVYAFFMRKRPPAGLVAKPGGVKRGHLFHEARQRTPRRLRGPDRTKPPVYPGCGLPPPIARTQTARQPAHRTRRTAGPGCTRCADAHITTHATCRGTVGRRTAAQRPTRSGRPLVLRTPNAAGWQTPRTSRRSTATAEPSLGPPRSCRLRSSNGDPLAETPPLTPTFRFPITQTDVG